MKKRTLRRGVLALGVAGACLVGTIATYRFLLHPLIESAFGLDTATSSIVRRIDIFAILVLVYWGFVRFFERRTASELAPRWMWMLVAGAAGAASIGVTIFTLYATGHFQVVSTQGIRPAIGVFGTLWIAAVLEEIAFRGILFRLLEESTGTRLALVTSAIVFGVAHIPNNGTSGVTFAMVTLAGFMWGEVFILSRNIWVTAAHHFCWNAAIFVIGLPLSGEEDMRARAPFQTVYHGSTLWTGGLFGPENSLINILVLIGICVALWQVAGRREPMVASR